MSGHLHVTATNAERDAEAAARSAMIVAAGGIRDMLRHVAAGGTAVAKIEDVFTGFHLPEGATISFSDSCPKIGDPFQSALRHQAEARVRPDPADMPVLPDSLDVAHMMSRILRPGARLPQEPVVMTITGNDIALLEREQSRPRLHRTPDADVLPADPSDADIAAIWAEAREIEEATAARGGANLPAARAPLFTLTLGTQKETAMPEPKDETSGVWTAVWTDMGELETTTVDYNEEHDGPVEEDQAMVDFEAIYDDNGTGVVLGVYPTDDAAEALEMHRKANPDGETPAP